jgi:putative membrane protein
MLARSPLASFTLRTVVSALALFVAAQLVPDISYVGWTDIALVAIVFGVVNAVIRPLALLVTCLINVLTLGLFTLVVNAVMLLLTSWLAGVLDIGFHVGSFWGAFFGALIAGVVSWGLSRFVR